MVSIPTKLKYFLILIITFGIIYWFQMVDDKKRCKEKRNNYDKIKLPLLVSAIVGLILLLNNNSFTNIFITSDYNKHSMLERPIEISIERIIERPIELSIERPMDILNRHNNLDIYTGLPEW